MREPPQAVFQVRLCVLGGAAAALGHEEDLVAAVALARSPSHPLLGRAVVVVPGVVQERDAFVDRPLDQPDAVILVGMNAAVIAAQADHGDHLARPSRAGRMGMPSAFVTVAAARASVAARAVVASPAALACRNSRRLGLGLSWICAAA